MLVNTLITTVESNLRIS